jgi:hypothetical protein
MHTYDLRSIWETYVSAWKELSPETKRAALHASTDPQCVYRDPLEQTNGHETLVDYMLHFHQQIPGGFFETTYFLAHHNRSIARWNMRAGDGTILGDGISYGEYSQDGRLVTMTGFFETPRAKS